MKKKTKAIIIGICFLLFAMTPLFFKWYTDILPKGDGYDATVVLVLIVAILLESAVFAYVIIEEETE